MPYENSGRIIAGFPAGWVRLLGLVWLMGCLVFAGCASPKRVQNKPGGSGSVATSQVDRSRNTDSDDRPADGSIQQSGKVHRRGSGGEQPGDSVLGSLSAGYAAATMAREQIGRPYVHGGETPTAGFDCSGLVQYVYGQQGINLPRTVKGLFRSGHTVRLRELQPGDLLFYRIHGNRVSHVGIYMGDNEFIHAPRRGKPVQIVALTNPWWQERFAAAKRVY
ncbi:MAG: C40 family peptidase [bacterium]